MSCKLYRSWQERRWMIQQLGTLGIKDVLWICRLRRWQGKGSVVGENGSICCTWTETIIAIASMIYVQWCTQSSWLCLNENSIMFTSHSTLRGKPQHEHPLKCTIIPVFSLKLLCSRLHAEGVLVILNEHIYNSILSIKSLRHASLIMGLIRHARGQPILLSWRY